MCSSFFSACFWMSLSPALLCKHCKSTLTVGERMEFELCRGCGAPFCDHCAIRCRMCPPGTGSWFCIGCIVSHTESETAGLVAYMKALVEFRFEEIKQQQTVAKA